MSFPSSMKDQVPCKHVLQEEYEADFTARRLIIKELENYIDRNLSDLPSNLTVKGRVKSFKSFFKKYIRYAQEIKSKNNKSDIQNIVIPDTIGIRIICPFIEDTQTAENIVGNIFDVTEIERKGSGYTFKEFGYESTHLLFKIPSDIGDKYTKLSGGTFTGEICEIQIRTILQDAWAEVEHELVYKAEFRPFDAPMKRKLAAINASLSLADTIFQEIRHYQCQLNGQLEQRHNSFFEKIEEKTDTFIRAAVQLSGRTKIPNRSEAGSFITNLNNNEEKQKKDESKSRIVNINSIDDLLLNALYSHNRGDFNKAVEYYSSIIKLNPDAKTEALIYKHRGMAYFAQSLYEKSIEDFSKSLEIDKKSEKPAYYRGVVRLVLQHYQAAIEDFSISISINQYQPFCFYRRAQSYYHLEDYTAALADVETAMALNDEVVGAEKLKTILMKKLKM
ncbi:MAG: RelA/SpoT domain-containing protein [Termitinemataceae bacterium]|nr:MAG: RelA/SpoT domain-containing protein [Termitinemataceae bacterium]